MAESATLTVTTETTTPQDQERICTLSSTEDECDKLELLKFKVLAEKDDILLTDAVVNLSKTGAGTASATAAYIYDIDFIVIVHICP